MRSAGKAEAQPSVQGTMKLPEGQGQLCSRWPPLNTSRRNSPKASLAEGLTALPGCESHVEKALLCSQAAPVHGQQLGMRWEEGAECAQDWGLLDGPWVLFSYSYVARRH